MRPLLDATFAGQSAHSIRFDLESGWRCQVFALAEYFPGGGTDFQQPLSAALECLQQARYKRGDIVFITDGECRVDAQWLSEFKRAKEQLGFSLFSVLIDVGSSSLGALKDFSDKITTVSQLTSEAGKELFLKI